MLDQNIPRVAESSGLGLIKRQTIREKLITRLRFAEMEVENLKEAVKALDENPGFEKVHDVISKVGF